MFATIFYAEVKIWTCLAKLYSRLLLLTPTLSLFHDFELEINRSKMAIICVQRKTWWVRITRNVSLLQVAWKKTFNVWLQENIQCIYDGKFFYPWEHFLWCSTNPFEVEKLLWNLDLIKEQLSYAYVWMKFSFEWFTVGLCGSHFFLIKSLCLFQNKF